MRAFKRHPERVADSQRSPQRTGADEVSSQVDDTLEEIDCCLAEVAQSDEEAAERAFRDLRTQRAKGVIATQEMKDRGDLLRIQYAHTRYVQAEHCCSCGCPWNA